jgi:hypothetical protein
VPAEPDGPGLVLSVHHSVRHTFNDTAATKLIESHLGRAYVEAVGVETLRVQAPPHVPGQQAFQPAPGMNLEQRRRPTRSTDGALSPHPT